jgi:hypothetical protein
VLGSIACMLTDRDQVGISTPVYLDVEQWLDTVHIGQLDDWDWRFLASILTSWATAGEGAGLILLLPVLSILGYSKMPRKTPSLTLLILVLMGCLASGTLESTPSAIFFLVLISSGTPGRTPDRDRCLQFSCYWI